MVFREKRGLEKAKKTCRCCRCCCCCCSVIAWLCFLKKKKIRKLRQAPLGWRELFLWPFKKKSLKPLTLTRPWRTAASDTLSWKMRCQDGLEWWPSMFRSSFDGPNPENSGEDSSFITRVLTFLHHGYVTRGKMGCTTNPGVMNTTEFSQFWKRYTCIIQINPCGTIVLVVYYTTFW